MLQQAYTPSNTGIASFVHASADYDLAPIGIGSMREQVDRLAEFGRNGDIYVVHAAEGETVIPMEVLDSNPKVKEMLFAQMRDMGLDPNEFVVGNELNSINPVTGMPEFFFGGIFRAVKNVVKSVVKIVKKVAPIALPIAAAMFGVPFLSPTFFGAGTFGASFLGGGIGSLIGGASIGDALKSGFLSGITTVAVGAGKGLLPGGKGFLEGATDAFYNPDALTFGENISNFSDIFSSDVPGSFGDKTKTFLGIPEADSGMSNVDFTGAPTTVPDPQAGADLNFTGGDFTGAPTTVPTTVPGAVPTPPPTVNPNPLGFTAGQTTVNTAQQAAIDNAAKAAMAAKDANASYFTLGLDNKLLGGPSIGAADLVAQNSALGLAPSAATKAAAASLNPGTLQRLALPGALAAGAASLGGVFGAPEESDEDRRRREEAERQRDILRGPNPLYAANPKDYLVGGGDPDALNPNLFRVERATGPGPSQVASQATQPVDFGRATSYRDYMRNRFGTPLQNNPDYARYTAADGGFIDGPPQYLNYGGTAQYPRREMLVEGPGTERSDDIPAMLSDGEFVLNARSVRGADPTGQGNRYRGAQNLYSMMRNFEMKG